MIETLAFGALCFIVGYMTRPRLSEWWRWNRPIRCQQCGKWLRYRHTDTAQHRLAGRVRVCKGCWRNLYKPFEGTK